MVAAARCLGAVSARLGRRVASYQEESVAALTKALSVSSTLATGAARSSFSLASSLPTYVTREQAAAAMPCRGSPLEAPDKVKVLLLRALAAVIRGASCGGRRDPGTKSTAHADAFKIARRAAAGEAHATVREEAVRCLEAVGTAAGALRKDARAAARAAAMAMASAGSG